MSLSISINLMMDPLKPLFKYLDAEQIHLDKEEFEFQFNSHPDFPSLLALSDTLNFFNINNGAFKIKKSEIDLLPNTFIARLKKGHTDFLSFVEKKDNSFLYTNGSEKNNSVPKNDFESLWDDVVLLAEHEETLLKPKSKNWFNRSLLLISLLLFASVLFIDFTNIWFVLFYAFPIIGVLFSIAALKDIFSTKNKLLDKFCNVTATTSCNTVVNSVKWKIFNTINFSDLSILFFATQISTLFLMGLSNHNNDYFSIQTILLILATPILMASLYYQKFIEKKWCPICLVIIGVVLAELFYTTLALSSHFSFNITPFGLLLFLAITTLLMALWFPLKNILKKVNHLKTAEQKANRFKRNYVLFIKMLTSSELYSLPNSPLLFGKPNAPLKISIITSPYCGHCREPHYMLKTILGKYKQQLSISIYYSLNPKNVRLEGFLKHLITFSKDNPEAYYKAMDYWDEFKDDDKWLAKHKTGKNNGEMIDTLHLQHAWFREQGFNFTPCLFVNGYKYPDEYEIADLPFFIDELLDDEFFNVEKYIPKIAATEKL
tara:strand:+ start:16911 stop:18548 length:1638 start_codon:yes stop_codon:yes gene_type:complete